MSTGGLAGAFALGALLGLLAEPAWIRWMNWDPVKRHRARPYPIKPVRQPPTPMPPAVEADDLEAWAGHLLAQHRRGRHALPNQSRLAITSGDAA